MLEDVVLFPKMFPEYKAYKKKHLSSFPFRGGETGEARND